MAIVNADANISGHLSGKAVLIYSSVGHLMFHFPKEKVLIGGDLIICGAVGRTDLPGCDPIALHDSIRKVMKLPPETHLLPGHCDPSTLADEMGTNEYVRAAVRTFAPRRSVVALSITNEANLPGSPNTSDGFYAGVRTALVQGVIAVRAEADRLGRPDLSIGFSYASSHCFLM